MLIGNLSLAVTFGHRWRGIAVARDARERADERPLLGGGRGPWLHGRADDLCPPSLSRGGHRAPPRAGGRAHRDIPRRRSWVPKCGLPPALRAPVTRKSVASIGERSFRAVCMACHARDERRVGPPLTEIVDIYAGNPDGLISWVKAPGKKRAGYPEMPPIAMQEGTVSSGGRLHPRGGLCSDPGRAKSPEQATAG